MKLRTAVPSPATPDDADLAAQARPGYGIPSQDPKPGAQFPLDRKEVEREAGSVLVAGAAMAGTATGAAIGVAVAGPVGVLVGGTVGALAGALGGAAAGSALNPPARDPTTPDADLITVPAPVTWVRPAD